MKVRFGLFAFLAAWLLFASQGSVPADNASGWASPGPSSGNRR